MYNETEVQAVDVNELARSIAHESLYAAENEADRLLADFPDSIRAMIPARDTVSGEARLQAVRAKLPLVERILNAEQARVDGEAATQARVAEQRDRNEKRSQEAANYQAFLKTRSANGEAYVPLHDWKELNLTSAQLAAWKNVQMPAQKAPGLKSGEAPLPTTRRFL
jgi:hypothetical protein